MGYYALASCSSCEACARESGLRRRGSECNVKGGVEKIERKGIFE